MKYLTQLNKFKNYFKELFVKRLFSFKGRASRKEYITRLATFLILLTFINIMKDYFFKSSSGIIIFRDVIFTVLVILYFLQYFPLVSRRLHDLNISGWRGSVYILFVVILTPFFIFTPLISNTMATAVTLIILTIFLFIIFKKGTPGPNKYGEPPS